MPKQELLLQKNLISTIQPSATLPSSFILFFGTSEQWQPAET